MLRVENRAAHGPSTPSCPACFAPALGPRCDECGAAQAPGGYEILRVLSRSPHSRVYLARAPDGRQVALKELVFSMAPDVTTLDAFEREARVLATLDHLRIPRFLGSFREGTGVHQRLYLAQEYVPGNTLAEVLRARSLSEAEVESITRQLLRVVGYLHQQSPALLHRDIKPANLILGENDQLTLVDFGIARGLERGFTHNATLVGTFGYMAPEQLGGTVSPQSDLYAIGVTVLELLARRPPTDFLKEGLELVGWQEKVPARWRPWLERMLATKSRERFHDTREASTALVTTLQAAARVTPRRRPTRYIAWASMAVLLWVGGTQLVKSTPYENGFSWSKPAARLDGALRDYHRATTDVQRAAALHQVETVAPLLDETLALRAEDGLLDFSIPRAAPALRLAWAKASAAVAHRAKDLSIPNETVLATLVSTGDKDTAQVAYQALYGRFVLSGPALGTLREALRDADMPYDQMRFAIRLLVKFDHLSTVEDALGALRSDRAGQRWWGYARLSATRPPPDSLVSEVRRLAKEGETIQVQGAARALLKAWGVARPDDPPPPDESDL